MVLVALAVTIGFAFRGNSSTTVVPTDSAASNGPQILSDSNLHVVNLDPDAIDVVVGKAVLATVPCGASAVLTREQIAPGPPWTIDLRSAMDGAHVGTVSVTGLMPRAILLRDGATLTGPWPMSYGPAPEPTCASTAEQGLVSIDREAGFELVLTSDRSFYSPQEQIRVMAHLGYETSVGPTNLLIHGGFGIVEPVEGIQLAPGPQTLPCPAIRIPTIPADLPFSKTTAEYSDSPFLREPELRLPPGQWRITATFSLSRDLSGQCAALANLHAVIAVTVQADNNQSFVFPNNCSPPPGMRCL
jgi:hypothetical protein